VILKLPQQAPSKKLDRDEKRWHIILGRTGSAESGVKEAELAHSDPGSDNCQSIDEHYGLDSSGLETRALAVI